MSSLATSFGISNEQLAELAEEELYRRRQRDFLLSEPYLFHKDILCPSHLQTYLRPFHRQGLEWLNRGGKRLKLILWPRGHLKSTIFTQGESIRRSLLNPNIRILINSSTYDMGKTFLSAIKGCYASDKLAALYGNLLPHNKSGKQYRNNEGELTLLSRTNFSLKEPTYTVSGLDTTKTSQHYDLMFHDDLVVRENIGNFEMMDKVWKTWQDSLDLLEPDGTMVVIGTRWHPLDLYGRILSDYVDARCFNGTNTIHVPNCRCQFDVSILTLRNDTGDYIFDSKFDDNIAAQLLQIKGQREFSAQYENNPASAENCWFQQDEIDASLCDADEIDKIRDKLVWYMAVDPAESLERRSSYTAVVCVGVDHQTGVWYVDYAKQARVDTQGFIDLIFDAHTALNPHFFGMETSTRKAHEYVLKDKMAQFGRFFTISELKPALGNAPNAKEIRIRGLRPLFTARRIKINRSLRDLISILYTIPSSTTYDLPDALSYIHQMVPKGLGAESSHEMPAKVMQNKGLSYAVKRTGTRNSFRYFTKRLCTSTRLRRYC
jgi:hypothetical protein